MCIMSTSAIAAQMKMKPYSHHDFFPKGAVPQSPESREPNRAFCISGLVVTTTTDSSLVSAGCGVKTGWCMPLTASLAALVKRLHNLTAPKRQNGLYRMNLPVKRTWFLPSLQSKNGVGRHWLFLCPFGELLPKEKDGQK